MQNNKVAILLVGIFSGLLWGLNDVFTNIIGHFEFQKNLTIIIVFSLALAWFQDICSSCAIFSYNFKRNFKFQLKQSKSSWSWLLIAAIFAGPLGMVAGIIGIDFAGPVYAGAITSCYPIVTLILALFFLKDQLNLTKLIGICLSIIATIAISILGEHSHIKYVSLGIFFASVAMIGWGLESVLLTHAYQKTHSNIALLLAIRQLFSSFFYLLILTILLFLNFHFLNSILIIIEHPILLFLCIITAASSYLAYYYFIKFVGPSLATVFNATFIFWSAVFSNLFHLDSTPNGFWLWASLLLIGLYFAEVGRNQKNKNEIASLQLTKHIT